MNSTELFRQATNDMLADIEVHNEGRELLTAREFGLLDGQNDPILDRITELAARLLDMPIALVAVMADSRWRVKSSYGLEVGAGEVDLPFCDRTVARGEMSVVRDALLDDELRDANAVRNEPGVRFYAGVPLVARGTTVGTLCLIDRVSRTFGSAERQMLDRLAEIVVEHLDLLLRHLDASSDRNKFKAVIEASPIAIITARTDGVCTSWNDAAASLFGWSREEALGTYPLLVPPELRAESLELTGRVAGGYFLRAFRTYRSHKSGRRIEVEMSARPVRDSRGKVEEVVIMHVDVTRRENQRAAERDRYEILALAANGSPLPEILARLVDSVEAAIPGCMASIVRAVDGKIRHATSGKGVPSEYAGLVDGNEIGPSAGSAGAAIFTGEPLFIDDLAMHPNYAAYGNLVEHFGLRASWAMPIRTPAGVAGALVTYSADSRLPTERERLAMLDAAHVASIVFESDDSRTRLQELARCDALTGLPNRTVFEERLKHELSRAKRTGSRIAVGVLDLDRFKLVNDSLGHSAGDRLLCEIATRLRRSLRDVDTVARMGGDEFAIVLPDVADDEETRTIAQRALESIAKLSAPDGNELYVRASLGFSVFPDDAVEPSQLIRLADRAMYVAKRNRSSIEFAAALAPQDGPSELTLETLLNQALERGELELAFQPIVRTADRSTAGAEALLRWNHPTLGTLPPARFIPIAEDTGLIVPIGKWVLGEACRFAERWRRAGGPGCVSVNVSPRQFEDRDFVSSVFGALRETGLDPSRLTLEITESLIMRSPTATAVTLQHLRSLGVRTAIDDFGSGYSSLNYLKRFPIDELKIDRSFVAEIGAKAADETRDEAIIGAIVAFGKALGGLAIVAEGVETEEQARFVTGAGCELGQGYLFARPMNAEHLIATDATFPGAIAL